MMSLASPRRHKASPPAAIQTATGDAYGTFESDEGFASGTTRPMRVSPRNNRLLRKSHASLLRAVGVAALFFVAAGYMVTQYNPQSASHLLRQPTEDTTQVASTLSLLSNDEKLFVDGVDKNNLRIYLEEYASKPHSAGSQRDYETVLYTESVLKGFGFETEIKEYYTLLSAPKRQSVKITGPPGAERELDLNEQVVPGDACTSDADALPPFLAYAATGNVDGSVVYANYGSLDDFEFLQQQGVKLSGKIALVRYGNIFRGLKVMLAEKYGMVGTLIYSDPQDDGYSQGDTYPDGPWRPSGSFQRGSAQFLSLYAGDPLTPGFPSTEHAEYIDIKDAKNIPHSPATVLSYAQAQYILQSLGGTKAPDAWQGGLQFDYFIGDDGATTVNLDIEIDNKIAPIWDVIGTIKGKEQPDEIVLIGNHRDAWVCGAIDPSSGSATLLEIARGYGELLKTGWKPRRTLKLASWDGEEFGLLGSTEYAEDNEDDLLKKAVAYINVDSVSGPYVSAAGTPSIAEFLYDTAKSVPANKFTGKEPEATLYEQWVAQSTAARAKNPGIEKGTLAPEHLISFLGSGTDFTPFYQHLGIISANLGFSIGDAPYGVYHSTMDSPVYLEKFADPQFTTQATTVKWWGLLALRLANEVILPFDFSTYGVVMHTDLTNLEKQTQALKLDIDYSRLRYYINNFIANAELFQARVTDTKAAVLAGKADAAAIANINLVLVRLERQFISEKGLAHRPWFRHVIFGPGFYQGYSGAAFPGISDGIAFKDDAETIQAHVLEVANIVEGAAKYLLAPK